LTFAMDNKKIDFVFGIHCHQPVGNFSHVFEDCYRKSYLPFIEMVRKHPGIRISFHYCGILLKWFGENHPEFLRMLKEMVDSGQAEAIGGGIYEPILPSIPEEDQAAQIRLMSSLLREKLGCSPKGAWLAERVWEPHLPRALRAAGIDFTLVDDHHFRLAGLNDRDIHGYFTTEEEGMPLSIFPINEKLRYLVPFKGIDQVLEFFEQTLRQDLRQDLRHGSQSEENGDPRLITLVDDGEKFGVWPGTHKWVYEEGWLVKFLQLLDENPWIRTLTLSEAMRKHLSRGMIYLPPGSYKEMLEWSKGFWRNFLVKYPESNNLHKKMLFVSAKVRELKDLPGNAAFRQARDELLQGQCNDPYWHGIFGGLYLNYLRGACYSHLIHAEAIADKELRGGREDWVSVEETDLNKDGKPEVILSNSALSAVISPFSGGQMFELDYKAGPYFNFTDTMTRRFEEYHAKIRESARGGREGGVKSIHEMFKLKTEGLEELLKYDLYRRVSLIDHFLREGMDIPAFRDSPPVTGFIFSPYAYRIKKDRNGAGVEMSREEGGISVEKTVMLGKQGSALSAGYIISNRAREEKHFIFGVEFNLTLLAGNDPKRYFEIPGAALEDSSLASTGETAGAGEVRLIDGWQGLCLSLSFREKPVVWRFPIYTVTQSESGIEQTYQGSTILPHWKISIPPGGKWENEIILEIKKL